MEEQRDDERLEGLDTTSEQRERYREILEELRTIIPGVQVLLAFLLTVPFSSRFDEVSEVGRALYGITVFCAGVATVLLMSPASYHRLTRLSQERNEHRRRRIRYSERVTVVGLGFLLASIIAGVLLVTHFVFGLGLGIGVTAVVAMVGLVSWYVVPLLRRPRK